MTRFFGKIGFVGTKETSPGIWEETTWEREYYGDVLNDRRRFENGLSINDNPVMVNYISIVADSHITENLEFMKWVEWNGSKWKITAIDLQYPRILLNFGGVWNG